MEGFKKVQILKALLLASLLVLCVQDVAAKKCNGSMDSAGLVEDEFEMDSMMTSRMLADADRYVSYGALKAGTVPCTVSGASYYNCRQEGATDNLYNHGCSKITKCRSGQMK